MRPPHQPAIASISKSHSPKPDHGDGAAEKVRSHFSSKGERERIGDVECDGKRKGPFVAAKYSAPRSSVTSRKSPCVFGVIRAAGAPLGGNWQKKRYVRPGLEAVGAGQRPLGG